MNIFCHFGSPLILHSDNGREFVNQVIHALLKLWPDCQMINGKARHSQSQGSVERCNRDIENMLACWQKDNSSNNWAHGLQFVMYAKNARYHSGIGRSAFKAQMGYEGQLGVQTLNLDKDILEGVTMEEQLTEMMPASFPLAVDTPVVIDVLEKATDTPADTPNVILALEDNTDLNKSLNNNELDEFTDIDEVDFVLEEEAHDLETIVTHMTTQDDITCCISCGIGFTPGSKSGALPCSVCSGICHGHCLVDLSCYLCSKSAELTIQRVGAKRKQQEQANRMLENSAKRFKPAAVGDTVLVPIPDLDRGRCEYPNLKAVVHRCKSGVLDQWYSRNQFQPTVEKFMNIADVPVEIEVSLRTAARQESIGGGQGYFRCNCTGNCITKRCKCF